MILLVLTESVGKYGMNFKRTLGSCSFLITYFSGTVVVLSRSFKSLLILIIIEVSINLIYGGCNGEMEGGTLERC